MPPKEDKKGKARARSEEPVSPDDQPNAQSQPAPKEKKPRKRKPENAFAVPNDLVDERDASVKRGDSVSGSEIDLDVGDLFTLPKKAKLEGFVPRKLPRPAPKFLQRPWLMPRVKPITPMKPLWNSVGNRTVYLAPSLNNYLHIPQYSRGMGAPP